MSSKISKLVVAIILIFSLIIGIYFYNNNNKTVIMNDKHSINNKSISIMLETELGSQIYEESEDDEWPEGGYSLNTTRSGCENGSTISFDDGTGEVVIRGNMSDKCYVYFDIVPPDLMVNVSNLPETYGKTATILATGATAVYNNKLNQLEITNPTTDKFSVSLTYSNPTSTTALNNYIIGLSGTTQGDGKVIHEIAYTPAYNSVSMVTTFGITPVYFQNTSSNSSAQTNVDDYWFYSNGTFTSNPSKFTISGTGNFYHVYTKVPSAGCYRVCYTIDQSTSSSNFFNIYKNNVKIAIIASSTSSQIAETCVSMGYLTTDDFVNISEKGYNGTSSPVMTFRIEKDNDPIMYDTGYRFEGFDPYNYVVFNNELWRIVGVFSTEYDSNNDGTADAINNLVKIIRTDAIGNLVMDKSRGRSWPNTSLYHLLNEQYYDWDNNKDNVDTYCYRSDILLSDCDYSINGINDNYIDMIVNAKWYLGGVGKEGCTNYIPEYIYSYERNENCVYTNYTESALGYIGILYESDYLYGVLASNCNRFIVHNFYDGSCSSTNWLFTPNVKFISTKSSNSGSVWGITGSGRVEEFNMYTSFSVYPTVYLADTVYKISGTGTITDPYIIGM